MEGKTKDHLEASVFNRSFLISTRLMFEADTKTKISWDNSIRCAMQVKVKYTAGFVPCTKRCSKQIV